MNKFKVGDKVKCTDSPERDDSYLYPRLTFGKIYEVNALSYMSSDICIIDDTGNSLWIRPLRFERVEIPSPFKVIKSSLDEICIIQLMQKVSRELETATANYAAFNSAHEGFAVLKEEVDELWEEVKVNQKNRNIEKMHKEAIQVAAMALRFAHDICEKGRGRV